MQDTKVPPSKSFSSNTLLKKSQDKDTISKENSDFIITDPEDNDVAKLKHKVEPHKKDDVTSSAAMRERRALLDRIDEPREWTFSQHHRVPGKKRALLDRIDGPREWTFSQHHRTGGKRGLLDRIDGPREWAFTQHHRYSGGKRAGILDRIDAPRQWTFSQHQRMPGKIYMKIKQIVLNHPFLTYLRTSPLCRPL